ncbi:hypothetical protein CANMA_003186 [Candida margitis]|uniref:uncharacterized protein n=1 Tax=Candida margitis TaxID=1775924 RepID=UPI0022277EBA|nr:uncharacterized protein CANMA_003186 [Candida margitis]KAI5967366.1 hypothetical protein CANMA_003186 [Candida margitis]
MASIAPGRNSEIARPATAIKRNNPVKANSESITPSTTANASTKRVSKSGPEQNAKLSIRLLPPALKEDEFLNQLANIYPHHATKIDQHYFVPGSYPSTPFELPVYSRAYVSFKNSNDSLEFCSFVKNKPFQDEKDSIIPIVEKSVFQKMISSESFSDSKRGSQNDKTFNLLEDDEIYKKFLLYLDKGLNEFNLKKIHKSLNKKQKEGPKKDQSVSVSKGKKHKKDKKDKGPVKIKEGEKDKQKKLKKKTKQNGKEREEGKVAKGDDKSPGNEKDKENKKAKKKKKKKLQAPEMANKTTSDERSDKDISKNEHAAPAAGASETKKNTPGGSNSRSRQRNRKKGGEKKENDSSKKDKKQTPTPNDFKPIKILSKKSNQEASEGNVKSSS